MAFILTSINFITSWLFKNENEKKATGGALSVVSNSINILYIIT